MARWTNIFHITNRLTKDVGKRVLSNLLIDLGIKFEGNMKDFDFLESEIKHCVVCEDNCLTDLMKFV